MRFQKGNFEIRAAAEKIKRLAGALFLLVLSTAASSAQSGKASVAAPTPVPTPVIPAQNPIDAIKPITIAEATDLALKQVSAFRGAQIAEQIAAQDVRLARAALYPKFVVNPSLLYTSPELRRTAGQPRQPSFLGADAIYVYQGLTTTTGELDTSGRLRAALGRNRALLESARAGSEIARRDLIQAVGDAYFNLALSTTRRRGAESNLQAAREFEANTKLQLDAGEVAPVDLIRTRLQTSTRSNELAQAQTDEAVNGEALRFLVGYNSAAPIAAEDLLTQMPVEGDIERCTDAAIQTRPEFAQFEADRRAAEQDAKAARAERRPQITYLLNSGFISDTLAPQTLLEHRLGVQATIGVNFTLFDHGASKSRETQARLRVQQAENSRVLARRQFGQAFSAARTQAVSAASRIKQIAATITDAEQNLSASMARYRAGEASIVEVTDAQNTLIAQRQALYQAIFDYQTARARLLRAIGQ